VVQNLLLVLMVILVMMLPNLPMLEVNSSVSNGHILQVVEVQLLLLTNVGSVLTKILLLKVNSTFLLSFLKFLMI